MEKTGSLNSFTKSLAKTVALHEKAESSNAVRREYQELKNLAEEIRSIGKTKNLGDILGVERALLRSELAKCSDDEISGSMKSSLTSAVTDLDNANKAIRIVTEPEKYREFNEIISVQKIDRKDGLPKDAFHRFIDSHKTRLGNRIKSAETSFEERLLLTERYKNMETCKKEYMKLQSNALGIKLPEKSKERER